MTTKQPIPMYHSEAYGSPPAWVWRAIAGSCRDAGDAMPVLILRADTRSDGIPIGPRAGLVVLDLEDWQALDGEGGQ